MIELTNLYLIRNCGCDDTTTGLAHMTNEQLAFFKNIIENLNKNSTYGCMPTIVVHRVDESMFREAEDDDSLENIMYLDDHKYVFEDGMRWQIYTDEFQARKVI